MNYTIEDLRRAAQSRIYIVNYFATHEGWPQKFVDRIVHDAVVEETSIFLSLFLPFDKSR